MESRSRPWACIATSGQIGQRGALEAVISMPLYFAQSFREKVSGRWCEWAPSQAVVVGNAVIGFRWLAMETHPEELRATLSGWIDKYKCTQKDNAMYGETISAQTYWARTIWSSTISQSSTRPTPWRNTGRKKRREEAGVLTEKNGAATDRAPEMQAFVMSNVETERGVMVGLETAPAEQFSANFATAADADAR